MKSESIINFFKKLINERINYAEMIDFCCDNMILNNDLESELSKRDFYFEPYCGELYNEEEEEEDYYMEVYQQYIISERDAERIAEYTNETVIYSEELNLYLLCVTHFGTPWNGVSANWKTVDEFKEG